MLDSVKEMLQSGVSPDLIMNVVISAVALFIMLKVKDFISEYAYWTKFKGSTIVSFGTWISVGTQTGSKKGVVLPTSNRKRIAVDFGDTVRYYTPKNFMTGHFEVVKSHP